MLEHRLHWGESTNLAERLGDVSPTIILIDLGLVSENGEIHSQMAIVQNIKKSTTGFRPDVR